METFAMNALPEIFEDMNTTDKLGILDGTLYEVLETSYVGEDASVAAIGFNITCGYLPQPNASWNENGTWDFVFPSPIPSVSLSGRGTYTYPTNLVMSIFLTVSSSPDDRYRQNGAG
jgi:hypothetical protein